MLTKNHSPYEHTFPPFAKGLCSTGAHAPLASLLLPPNRGIMGARGRGLSLLPTLSHRHAAILTTSTRYWFLSLVSHRVIYIACSTQDQIFQRYINICIYKSLTKLTSKFIQMFFSLTLGRDKVIQILLVLRCSFWNSLRFCKSSCVIVSGN